MIVAEPFFSGDLDEQLFAAAEHHSFHLGGIGIRSDQNLFPFETGERRRGTFSLEEE